MSYNLSLAFPPKIAFLYFTVHTTYTHQKKSVRKLQTILGVCTYLEIGQSKGGYKTV